MWKSLSTPVLEPGGHNLLFSLVHNVLPNRERLYDKFHMVASPKCGEGCGVIHDNVHLFCECSLVREVWFWIRTRILTLLPNEASQTSNFEMINLMFVESAVDDEILFLIGTHVELVWKEVVCKKNALHLTYVREHMKNCFTQHNLAQKPPLSYIHDVS